jgi:hypothetical protein
MLCRRPRAPRSGCQGLTLPRPPLLSRPPVAMLVRSLVATLPLPLVATLVRAPVAVVVVAVDIAVKVVVADAPFPVEAPAWVPKIPGAPVIRGEGTGLGLGGSRREPQTCQP